MIYQRKVTYKTSTATLTYAEMGDVVVNSASDVTITLPAPNNGLWYRVSNVGTGVVTIYYGSVLTTLKQTEQALMLANGTSGYWMSRGSGDMTKAEIENILTGEITSHYHPNPDDMTITDLTDVPDYATYGGKILAVKADESGMEYVNTDQAANGIPSGGVTNQLFAKKSDADYDGKWVDAPESANGIPSGGTTGQILYKVDGTDYNAKWADVPYENSIDKPPSSPSAWDDEFDDESIDPKWSWFNQGTSIATETNGFISIPLSVGGDHFQAFAQTVPNVPFILTGCFRLYAKPVNYFSFGLILYNSGNEKIINFGPRIQGGAIAITNIRGTLTSWSGDSTYSGEPYKMYVKIGVTSTDITFYFSPDGDVWTLFSSETISNFLSNITHIGIGGWRNNGDSSVIMTGRCDWFRVTES